MELPKKSSTYGRTKRPRLVKIGEGGCSFENRFLYRSYYSGEHQLDNALLSLIHLSENCLFQETSKYGGVLININNVRKVIRARSIATLKKFEILSKESSFDYLTYMSENKISLDRIVGVYPLEFKNYRMVLHSLKLSYAFLLTMKMKHYDLKFKQRTRSRKSGRVFAKKNQFAAIFRHILMSFIKEGINDEIDMVKCIKTSLCYHVSSELDQKEFPKGHRINLIPLGFKSFFDNLEKEKRIEFFFSLLQSKSLCQEVPESFVNEALQKHRNLLKTPQLPLKDEIREMLFRKGKEFGARVLKYYNPEKGYFPTNKATCFFPRNKGGVKGDLVYNQRLSTGITHLNEKDRSEPMVIGLFGQPGMGKSKAIPQIVNAFATLFPGVSTLDLTYERSCNVDHWDGYNGQPIVILDDIGQSMSGKDIKEFQNLVSCNPYVLPMADLAEKGRYFTSPLIILTSNLSFGQKLNYLYEKSDGILDDASFWRRIHCPIHVEFEQFYVLKEQPSWIRPNNLISRKGTQGSFVQVRNISKLFFQDGQINNPSKTCETEPAKSLVTEHWVPSSLMHLLDEFRKEFRVRKRYHDNYRKIWNQKVETFHETYQSNLSEKFWEDEVHPLLSNITKIGFNMYEEGSTNSLNLNFPAFPPHDPLPVRVSPIREPLKVRIITAGVGDSFCLKPLQTAMWRALGEYKQFALTHGEDLPSHIQRIYEKYPDEFWLSGDYTAATDSVPLEATQQLMLGILENFTHEPTKRWAMKEISPHVLVYPEGSGLKPILQESGQLMGSLLSFPLLCLLNDCTAQYIGLSSDQYLINGDDILMRCPEEKYQDWKGIVNDFGFSLSLGKNYVHKTYGTINSQLVCDGSLLQTGKQRILDRRSQVLGECLRDLEVQMGDSPPEIVQELFKSVNRQKLSRTVRSIRVPVSHGGLALSWGDETARKRSQRKTEILVYLNDLFRKIQSSKGCISIPYLSHESINQNRLESLESNFMDPLGSSEYFEDFVGVPDICRAQRRLMSNPQLRNLFLEQKIEVLPSLSFLGAIQIPFTDAERRKSLQQSIDSTFFKMFLDPQVDYSYNEFRTRFLKSTMSIPNSESSTKFLVKMMDLNLKQDTLTLVSLARDVRSFSSKIFEKDLGKALSPKKLDLGTHMSAADYSLDVCKSFDLLHDQFAYDDEVQESFDLSWFFNEVDTSETLFKSNVACLTSTDPK